MNQYETADVNMRPAPTEHKQGSELHTKLILISAYCIGKEKILNALSAVTGLPVHVDEKKMKMMKCLGIKLKELEAKFTLDPTETPLHCCRMGYGCYLDTYAFDQELLLVTLIETSFPFF